MNGPSKPPDSLPQPDWVNLRAGCKNQQFTIYQEEIRDFYHDHGFQETMEYYHISRNDTLERLLTEDRRVRGPVTEIDRLKMKVGCNEATISDLRKEIKELREVFEIFQNSVADQIQSEFLLPLIRRVTKLPPEIVDKALPKKLVIEDAYTVR